MSLFLSHGCLHRCGVTLTACDHERGDNIIFSVDCRDKLDVSWRQKKEACNRTLQSYFCFVELTGAKECVCFNAPRESALQVAILNRVNNGKEK